MPSENTNLLQPSHFFKKNFLIEILISALICTALSYFYIDKPVAFWINYHGLYHYSVFRYFTYIADTANFLVLVYYLCLFFKLLFLKEKIKITPLFMTAEAFVISAFIKQMLKIVFGRTWPSTWIYNNASLLHDGAYGFNFFHGSVAYSSFPSGHTAAIFSMMVSFWIYYPKFRWLYLIPMLLVPIGLIAMNYHFVSDVLAGALLGTMTAYMVSVIMH